MADEIRAFQVTTPVGVFPAAPLITDLTMPPRVVKGVEAMVPGGCNGALGFALGSAGQPVIPYNPDGWIVASGDTLRWDLDRQIDSGAWQILSWNTGRYPHTVYLRFMLGFIPRVTAAPTPAPLPVTTLSTLTPATMLDLLTPLGSETFGV